MDKKDSQAKIAHLESHIDLLETELSYLNHMLIQCGFPQGITTLKLTVQDLLNEASEMSPHAEDFPENS